MLKSSVIGALIFILLTLLVFIVPSRPSFLAYSAGICAALVIIIHYILSAHNSNKKTGKAAVLIPMISLSSLFLLLPFFFAGILFVWGALSFFTWMLVISLCVVFYINFLCVPLAIYQKRREIKQAHSLNYFPSISILIPAYNEEKVLRRAIETTIEASYPTSKEIIVVNDGSTDMTYSIAQEYSNKGVKVINRPNGGKAVAINHGLHFAQGEIIIIVDADSLVGKNTLIELVQPLRDPNIAAIAGNIKVLNRVNWLTRCQALEYIASINIYRRALDVFGSVTVVPGALGAYRREVLEGSGLYDSDTLVEDFDVTMKTLKTGKVVQASTTAIAYTEAPQTFRDLIKQRLRWYRGNFQALWKHRDAAYNSRYGFLQKLAFPSMVISMVFTPFASMITILSAIMAIVSGGGMLLIPTFLFFCLLQFLFSLLAIELDNEDRKLTLYTPLFIFGYKQLCDFTVLKGMIDVISHRGLKWTNVRRIGAKVSKSAVS